MLWGLLILVLYFLPTVVAYHSKKKNKQAICVTNVLLGWTLIGWIVALVWATTKD